MVRLGKLSDAYEVDILAKCEFLNPGGSVKDRIGWRMVEKAEAEGRIHPGDTLIEPTSGNTGIGLAMAAAIKGYRMIIVMPTKMSMEKQLVLEALGAQIVRTESNVPHDHPDSLFGVSKKLASETPNSHILDQYKNVNNWEAHYHGTAVEIIDQVGGKLDYFVASAGTGGTITGCGRRLKEAIPGVKVIGADPEGSILGGGEPGPPYKVEGIGYDFFPDVLDTSVVDHWVKTNDLSSFRFALDLIRDEAMLVGGSSGAAIQAALEVAKSAPKGSRMVVILPDSIRNYMSKHLDPNWRERNGV